ncbi:uncharacterized protein LOC131149649 [Malania oleifera]|uniref:uncharacterized protein LOC131149649 n=1 Tax=Malania oleifera TaxID=397392 RepID=UPI0025ADB5B0|nr:uncharacterized protein LOC131149649 [Malania oleifera]
MDRHIQVLLNKISCVSITIATFTLLLVFLQIPDTCVPEAAPPPPAATSHKSLNNRRFPKSSCDFSHREHVSIEKKNKRIWSTKAWAHTLSSYTLFFRDLNLLGNHSKVLCVSAGPGHAVMALTQLGVADVTGIEVIDSPPLVNKADPHNLPFFDHVFDLAFTANFPEALFPARLISEMERTVRPGGFCVLAVQDCSDEDVREIVGLFRRAKLVSAVNVTLIGLKMARIIMRITIPS